MFEDIKQDLHEQVLVAKVLAKVVAIWIVSDIGYYSLAVVSGVGSGFNTHPFILTAYYLLWVGITLGTFWSFYKGWKIVEVRPSLFAMIFFGSVGVAYYILYILPLFPAIHWASQWIPPSELLTASVWYFLPKSVEIVLQQLLVAAMVLAFDMHRLSLKKITLWSAVLFGTIHLLLVFSGSTPAYVLLFTASAVAAGALFPYLMLRIRNGFMYSFFLHWGFYAVVIVLARAVFKL